MQEITIKFDEIDNLLDLANLLKYLLKAEVRILQSTEKNGIALIADAKTAHHFLRAMEKPMMTIYVFIDNTVRLYLHENVLSQIFDPAAEDLAEKPDYSFKSIKDFVEFLRVDSTPITFPEISIESFPEINLEERARVLAAWKEELEKLIPYGVEVKNQVESDEGAGWIFSLFVPSRPVPAEIAQKNECHDDYHDDYNNGFITFRPGEKDWNEKHAEVIEKLKVLYSVEKLNKEF